LSELVKIRATVVEKTKILSPAAEYAPPNLHDSCESGHGARVVGNRRPPMQGGWGQADGFPANLAIDSQSHGAFSQQ
jgi:hypothetical protein